MKMKLVTQEIAKKIPALYAQDGLGEDATVYLKLFTPWTGWTGWTWLITEMDPETRTCFGYAFNSQAPDCAELGYISLDELDAIKGPWGLFIERDRHFQPCRLGDAIARCHASGTA